jgi:hypothetical protein
MRLLALRERDMGRHLFSILVVCLAVVVGLLGCGGGNEPFRGETDFVGPWYGTYRAPGTGDSGLMTLTISSSAVMVGTYQNLLSGETGRVRGAVNPDGGFNATFTADGSGRTVSVNGYMGFPDAGSRIALAGDGTWSETGMPVRGFTFDLNRDSGGTSPFQASLAGTWAVPGTTEGGPMTLTVNQNGTMTGSFTNTGRGTAGAIQGQVTNDGTFVGVFIENGTGDRIEIQGQMDRMADEGLAGDGTYTRPGEAPQGFTFTLPNGTGGTTGG